MSRNIVTFSLLKIYFNIAIASYFSFSSYFFFCCIPFLPNDGMTSRSENVDNPYAPVSPLYLKKIVRIPVLSILPLQSLENLIFSLDPFQSMAVRAPRKKYVSVVSLGIAYRSRRETSFHTRVFHPPWPRFSSPENAPPKHGRSNNGSLDQHPDNRIAF